MSMHSSLVMVLSQALGGSPSKKAPNIRDANVKDVTAGAPTVEAAVLNINRMLSF
jgi:hypothetical protein